MTNYGISARQLESVMLMVQSLNDMSKNLDSILEGDPEGLKLGDGHLLMLESPIRIISDSQANYGGDPEVFGWVVEDEQGWDFYFKKPEKAQELTA